MNALPIHSSRLFWSHWRLFESLRGVSLCKMTVSNRLILGSGHNLGATASLGQRFTAEG
jgi:hypothetical protein